VATHHPVRHLGCNGRPNRDRYQRYGRFEVAALSDRKDTSRDQANKACRPQRDCETLDRSAMCLLGSDRRRLSGGWLTLRYQAASKASAAFRAALNADSTPAHGHLNKLHVACCVYRICRSREVNYFRAPDCCYSCRLVSRQIRRRQGLECSADVE
jgi:hypothetical protein